MQFSATNWWVLLDTGDLNSSRVRVFQCSRLDNSHQLEIFVDMGELHFVHSWACYSFNRSFDACYNWTQPLVAYFFHFGSSSLTVSLLCVFEIEFFPSLSIFCSILPLVWEVLSFHWLIEDARAVAVRMPIEIKITDDVLATATVAPLFHSRS